MSWEQGAALTYSTKILCVHAVPGTEERDAHTLVSPQGAPARLRRRAAWKRGSREPARRFLWAPGLGMILYPDGNTPALGNSTGRLFAQKKNFSGLSRSLARFHERPCRLQVHAWSQFMAMMTVSPSQRSGCPSQAQEPRRQLHGDVSPEDGTLVKLWIFPNNPIPRKSLLEGHWQHPVMLKMDILCEQKSHS